MLVPSPGLFLHILLQSRFVSQHNSTQTVHNQIDKQQMGNLQRLIHPEEGGNGADHYRSHIDYQLEFTEF